MALVVHISDYVCRKWLREINREMGLDLTFTQFITGRTGRNIRVSPKTEDRPRGFAVTFENDSDGMLFKLTHPEPQIGSDGFTIPENDDDPYQYGS